MTNTKIKYREQWLNEALEQFIVPLFKDAGYKVPKNIRLTCGWPAKGGLARKNKTIGQAWSFTASADGVAEIFISPVLAEPLRVLGVLIHEVIHATVGNEHGHKKPFVDCMKAVGLNGKPTATGETDELIAKMKPWLKVLGKYPHAELNPSSLPTQTTRLLKLLCDEAEGGCGMPLRVSQKWIDIHGEEWKCPCGGKLKHVD